MILFFFFQAEDGIRDWSVTGVQTCALPIFTPMKTASAEINPPRIPRHTQTTDQLRRRIEELKRSEERRVGKECRSRWWRDHLKKKKKTWMQQRLHDKDMRKRVEMQISAREE